MLRRSGSGSSSSSRLLPIFATHCCQLVPGPALGHHHDYHHDHHQPAPSSRHGHGDGGNNNSSSSNNNNRSGAQPIHEPCRRCHSGMRSRPRCKRSPSSERKPLRNAPFRQRSTQSCKHSLLHAVAPASSLCALAHLCCDDAAAQRSRPDDAVLGPARWMEPSGWRR